MNLLKTSTAALIICAAMSATSCSDKNAQILTEQTQKLNEQLTAMAEENPYLIGDATATYVDNTITVDVKLVDSLINLKMIPQALFDYFTACEVKEHLNKDLELTVNAMSEKKAVMNVNLTDAYGESQTFELTAAKFRQMVKSPLTQYNYNDARDAVLEYLAASANEFDPKDGSVVKGINTQFKGGFFEYNVDFNKSTAFKNLTQGNLKARALNVLRLRYGKLGTFKPLVFAMYKSLGIEGFHLVYTSTNNSRLSTSVKLANI